MIRFLHSALLMLRKREKDCIIFSSFIYIYVRFCSSYFYFIFITNRREHKSLLHKLDEVSQMYIYIYISSKEVVIKKFYSR